MPAPVKMDGVEEGALVDLYAEDELVEPYTEDELVGPYPEDELGTADALAMVLAIIADIANGTTKRYASIRARISVRSVLIAGRTAVVREI